MIFFLSGLSNTYFDQPAANGISNSDFFKNFVKSKSKTILTASVPVIHCMKNLLALLTANLLCLSD